MTDQQKLNQAFIKAINRILEDVNKYPEKGMLFHKIAGLSNKSFGSVTKNYYNLRNTDYSLYYLVCNILLKENPGAYDEFKRSLR